MEKRNKDEWFAVTMKLETKKIDEPFKDNEQFLYWVKKTFEPQDDLWWYNYELFSGNLEPTQLKEGSFVCVKMYEIVPQVKNDYYWFGFSIVDGSNMTNKNELMCEGEKGVIEIIRLMRDAARFKTWADYYAALKRLWALGYREETSDKME